MMTLVAIVHVVVALVLVVLVLVQDSKSDGALGMGGGASGSNSILGATGAQTLAAKLTVVISIIFAMTCLALTMMSSQASKSVVDSLPLPTAPAAATNGATAMPVTNPAPATAPAASAPATAPAATTK